MSEKIFQLTGAEEFYSALIKNAPDWFASFRKKSLDESLSIAIPSVKNEEWKYTSLALLANSEYCLPQHFNLNNSDQLWNYADKRDINFVMVNGCFISNLSNIDDIEGLEAMHLQEAVNQGLLKDDYFSACTSNDIQPFLAINGAYHRCGAYINIKKSYLSKNLIHIININMSDKPYSISPRNIVIADRSSQATILESHISINNTAYFVNPLTDFYLDQNAVIDYTKAQSDSQEAIHIGQTRVWQKCDSQFKSFSFMQGAKLTRNNVTVTIEGEGTYSLINGLYLLNDQQHADNHSLINHLHPNCESSQLYKGILNGASRAVFNGKIYVAKIAQKTNSYQLNKNLLLGSKARVDTKPQLEIFADDVKCTHGATIGQLSEEEIFYLQTRGITRKEAIKTLAKGFVNDIVGTISNEDVKSKLYQLLEPTFERL